MPLIGSDVTSRPSRHWRARQPFVGLVIAAVAGVLLADYLAIPCTAWLPMTGIFALAAIATYCWPHATSTRALVGFGFFLLHTFRTHDTPGQRLVERLGDRARVITAIGTVTSEPKVAPNGFATFLVTLESVQLEDTTVRSRATCLVRWRGTPEFGNELKVFGIAEPIPPPRNPGEFDMRGYLARRDVRRLLFVRYPEDGVLLRHGAGNPILRLAQKSRAWMQLALCRGLENAPDVQAFLSGIVLGQRHQTPEDIEEPFQQTGTLHIFAVAGLHVGIVARLLWMLGVVAQLPRKLATALIIPLLLFYAAITGLHVSSVRAAVMSSVLLGGFFVERKVFSLNSLAAAAFLILCWDTNELFSTGFQLSFAVVGAIILFSHLPFAYLWPLAAPDAFLPGALIRGARRWLHTGLEWLCRAASVSFAAWAGSLLLLLWYFYLVTPISLVANLIVVPMAFFILAIALLSMVAAPFLPSFSILFNNANWCLARLVLGIVHLLAQLPGGHYYIAHPRWPANATATITVLDVGTGAAIHVRSRGQDWLFDCASERDYQRVVRPYLHASGVNGIDGVLLTHGDSLHIGGALGLLEDFARPQLIDNPAPDRSIIHRRLRTIFQQRNLSVRNMVAGETFTIANEVTARVVHPPSGFAESNADDEASVVQVAVSPMTKILLTSDAGLPTENALLASGIDLKSDILIKGEHRSATSGSTRFLDAVRPQLIIATSRDFPESERISDDWAARMRARGIKLFRQDETGAVELQFGRREWSARAHVTGEVFRSANR
ncbi:MAG TPA: ComEC/Rec2 family competence protein [Chthoniobacterales bacterium]|nr:ComEC/Rec2 family competence protein [Chthoniobacterales bacterium]